jgi:transposase
MKTRSQKHKGVAVRVGRQDYNALPSEAQEELRRKAVKAVLAGKKQIEVAAEFGITRQAVNNWIRAYRSGGMRALKTKPKGRPRLVDARHGSRQ